MKNTEIRELSIVELKEKLAATEKQYSDMKLQHSISPLANPLEIRKVRRIIARLQTDLRKRELAEAN